MKIFISVISIKDIGGISTSIMNLLNSLSDNNEITLNVLTGYISQAIQIPSNVRLVSGSQMLNDIFMERSLLKKQTAIRKIKRNTLRLIRRIIGTSHFINFVMRHMNSNAEEFDVAIAFSNDLFDSDGVMTAGGVYKYIIDKVKAKRKIAWVHNDPKQCGFTRQICREIFKPFDAIVNVSYDCKKIFDEMIPEYKSKSFVVYNLYNIKKIKGMSNGDPYQHNKKVEFVTVSRLYNHQKKIDRIIDAVHKINKEGINNFHWTIVGEGVDRETIESLIVQKGLGDLITLVGLKSNPYPYMKYADAFVLTSLYEGYGMTIKEAQILGTPTLITEFGPAHETVEDGVNGLICENSTEGVYNMIKSVLLEPSILGQIRDNLKKCPVTNDIAIQQFYQVCDNNTVMADK